MNPAIRREALLQETLENKILCGTCERRCLLVEGGTGWCRTRINVQDKLYTLTYGAVSSLSANPIEKKPLYHFYPGSRALTAGSWSCNFGCPWCQNWDISKSSPRPHSRYMSPERFVEETQRANCQGTSISFNEPTLSLEWSLDVFRLARARALYNTYVTNGYMTEQALSILAEAGLDAMNVDVKGSPKTVRRYCKGVDIERVWARCQQARVLGIHLEITTLVIPEVNSDELTLTEIAQRIVSDLGPETPWHVSGYYPAYRFRAPPTRISTLEQACKCAKEAGLHYVYIGNVPGHPYDNTKCPVCGATLIIRMGFDILRNEIRDGCCPQCHTPIRGEGWNWQENSQSNST
ncbi:MAG: AmmeMemoRadiSam system radical SAM enzyme [Anaerolineales bacterium]|nr:AmmeMemoRadiSam system radical SAM enzyme [Anaerolineales bacterium]